MKTRKEVLKEVEKIICNDRNSQYGEPEDAFRIIAEFWTTYLSGSGPLQLIQPRDVANMMALMKMARLVQNCCHEDSALDLAGYAVLGAHLQDVDLLETPRKFAERSDDA